MRRKGDVARIREELQDRFAGRLEDRGRYRALLGDGAGNVRVTDKPNRAYARVEGRGQFREVINLKVPFRNDLPVIVAPTEESPRIWEVVGLDKYSLMLMGDFAYVPHHHQAHEFKNEDGGDDVVWVRKQQHIPMLVYPTDPPSMILNVYPDWYQWEGELHWYEGGQTTDLSAYQPVAPPNIGRYVLISLDLETGSLQYTQGDDFNLYLPPSEMDDLIPTIPDDARPLAAVIMRVIQDECGWDEIWDVRIMQGATGAGQFGPAVGDFDNWLELNATGTVSWAPDNVALLSGGIVEEYLDPDDAFDAAGPGDVVLIPPGDWILSALHTLTDASVIGLGGGPADCVLRSTITNQGSLVRLNTAGVAKNFSVDWDVPYSNGGVHIGLFANDDADAYFCESDVNIGSGTSQAYGVWVEGIARECIGWAHAHDGNASGITAVDGDVAFCQGNAETDGDGCAYGIEVRSQPANAPLFCCFGWGHAYNADPLWDGHGLFFGTLGGGDVYVSHGYYSGNDYDVIGYQSDAHFYSVKYDRTKVSLTGGSTLDHLPGDRTSWLRDEEINGLWTTERTVAPARIHRLTTAATGTTTELLHLISMSDATVGPEFAGSIVGRLEDNAGVESDAAMWEWGWDDPTAGAEDAFIRWSLVEAGAALTPYMKLTQSALNCQGSQELDIGSTDNATRWGNIFLAQHHDILADGEDHEFGGLMRRFVNKRGISNYTLHRGTGTVIPPGTTQMATPANLWATWLVNYWGWLYNTYYAHYPNHATNPAGISVATADPLGLTILTARCHVTGACNFGLWTDNFDANRAYVIGNQIYRYDVYLYGNVCETLIYTQCATSACTAPGVGVAATFAAWVNHALTGPYGPFCPCGDGIVIRLRANHGGTTTCYPYVLGEQGAASGLGGSQTLYDDAWPGTNPYAARRIGTFQRSQGYGWSVWDWYHLEQP